MTTYQVDVYSQHSADETYEGLTAAEANELIKSERRAGNLVNVMDENTGRWVIQDR